MNYLIYFIFYVICAQIFYLLIKRISKHIKITEKFNVNKFHKLILIVILLSIMFSLEYFKITLVDSYGKLNYRPLMLYGFKSALYMNVGMAYIKNKFNII